MTARAVVCILVSILGVVDSQFMLVWNTGPPGPTEAPFIPGVYSDKCVDKIDNCDSYGEGGCKGQFETWAKNNCPNYCNFCKGPTKAPPPCQDTIANCDNYEKSVCSDPEYKGWANNNCRYYCRLCSASQLSVVDSHQTTVPASACKDLVECRLYGKNSCSGTFIPWAKSNCPAYCGFCKGPNTPAPLCADNKPNCASYGKATCTDPNYRMWVEDNCKQYCGKCTGGPQLPATQPSYAIPPHPGK